MRRIFKRAPRSSPAPTGPDPQMRWEWPQGCNGAPVRGRADDDGSDPWGHFPGERRFQLPRGEQAAWFPSVHAREILGASREAACELKIVTVPI
jgi:hypothetical protein